MKIILGFILGVFFTYFVIWWEPFMAFAPFCTFTRCF